MSAGSGYGSIIPDSGNVDSHPLTKALGEKVGNYVEQYIESMEKVTHICIVRFTYFMTLTFCITQITFEMKFDSG